MASVRHRNDKKLTKLKEESKKLHAEVEALEDALMLHQRYKHEESNSIRGILRKEIGGSIWQHGGSGKLHSYRTTNDLEDPEKTAIAPNTSKRRQRRSKISNQKENELVAIGFKNGKSLGSDQTKSEFSGKSSKDSTSNGKDDQVKGSDNGSKQCDIKKDSNIETEKLSALKSKVIERASARVIHRNRSRLQYDSNKTGARCEQETNKLTLNSQAESVSKLNSHSKSSDIKTTTKDDFSQSSNKTSDRLSTDKSRNTEEPVDKISVNRNKQTNIKPSQALELSRDSEVLKILSMPSNQRKTPELSASRDLSSLLPKSRSELKNVGNVPPKCDPLMKEWIKSLGLIEEEKYLKLFTDNEIDMREVSQLTALQLNEMGITAFGALNKILRGIKELKQKGKIVKEPIANIASSKILLSNHSHQSALKSESGPTRLSKANDSDLHKSQTFEDRLNGISESKTNLRRSRSFIEPSSMSKDLYSNRVSVTLRTSQEKNLKEKGCLQIVHSTNQDDVEPELINVSSKGGNKSPSTNADKTENTSEEIPAKTDKPKTLRKRANSPARRPASSPAWRKNVSPEKNVESDIPTKKKCDSAGKAGSSNQKNECPSGGKKGSLQRQGSAKSKNTPVLWPRAKSAQAAEKKAKEGVAAAAKRFNEKQKQISEKEERHTKAKKIKKAQRDEMAARHEHRQQVDMDNSDEIDEGRVNMLDQEYEKERLEISELDKDISKLISVTVLDTTHRNEDNNEDIRQRDERPQRSKTKSNRPVRQSISRPVFIGANFPDDFLPQNKEKTYNHTRQSEVKTIESQIEILQSKALSGEMVTMDLVKDLQQRLEEIEQQIKDTKPPKNRPKYRPDSRLNVTTSMRGKDFEEVEKEIDTRNARSELSEVNDPLKSIEINQDDILFDSTDLIGEGTFSRVYHGVCLGTEVAIKQLKIPLTSHDKNYFAAEVSLLKELHHPRVVQLIGVCTSGKFPIMVLEFMANSSLYYCLHDPKYESMDHAEYYRVAHDIALGMNYLHQHKPQVLHLDLKSMNVLLDSSGRAKIADFGFSKFRHDADLRASKASKKKGSPSWMAPELLESGEITTKADVYSFGIILWEMLTRSHPYDGCSVFQILERARLNKRPDMPPSCPPELSSFIQKCWDQNPAKRPSFKDIILQLDKLAFPPDWRALFKEAGVPEQALEDVHSARTIISLVNNTVDLENVKTMMEDIKHSNDAIKASHDLTRKSHAFTSKPNNVSRQSHESVVTSQNFVVQSRKPQEQLRLSLRNSAESNPSRQSLEKVRNSGDSFYSRRSNNSPFTPKYQSINVEGDNKSGDSIEEEIGDVHDSRDSSDFEFNDSFKFDIHGSTGDKLEMKSDRDMRKAVLEDTTTEYLNYLKTSCEILSPSSSSPIFKRPSSSARDLILSDSDKADKSGAVVETIASIPPTLTSQNEVRTSANFNNRDLSTKNNQKQILNVEETSFEKSVKMSHEKLMQEMQKSGSDPLRNSLRSNSGNSRVELCPDKKVSFSVEVPENLDQKGENPELKKDSLLKMSHEKLMQEIQKSKPDNLKQTSTRNINDLGKESPEDKKAFETVRKSVNITEEKDIPNTDSLKQTSLRKSNGTMKESYEKEKVTENVRKSANKCEEIQKSNNELRKSSPLKMSHEKLMQEIQNSNKTQLKQNPEKKSNASLAESRVTTSVSENVKISVNLDQEKKNSDVDSQKVSLLKENKSLEPLQTVKSNVGNSLSRKTLSNKSHDNLMAEVRNSVSQLRKDKKPQPLARSRELAPVKMKKPAVEERLDNERSVSKIVGSKDLLSKTADTAKFEQSFEEIMEEIDRKEEANCVTENESPSDIGKSNLNTSLNENMMEEMKHLHSKLRSEKNEHVEEIKSLHTKLRNEKTEEKHDTSVSDIVYSQKNADVVDSDPFYEVRDSIENINDKLDVDNLSVDSLDLNDSITEDQETHVTPDSRKKIEMESHREKGTKEVPSISVSETNTNSNSKRKENASLSSENEITGLNKSVKALPDLRTSLNLEIAKKYSSLREMKKDSAKMKKEKEYVKTDQGNESEVKTKSSKKPKVDLDKKKVKSSKRHRETKLQEEKQPPRKSIEAWVEEKKEVPLTEKKDRKHKKSSSISTHPPPIVIPDVPPAPPMPIELIASASKLPDTEQNKTPPSPPPLPIELTMSIPPPPPPPLPSEQTINIHSDPKTKKLNVPAVKPSSQEAIQSSTKQSKGDNSGPLMVQSADLREQKEVLQSISKPHPNQLQDLSQVNRQTYTSIADILKRAVFSRREAMGEDNYSPSPSVASSWSFVDD